ncbi:GNAT family N-acetyltransferase [Solimonas terrae]|uniref:GNAT family N-acetyltransferase n=1 Tax=Solimonas terrae TaxID=1396819 RepID=A0A6M2BSW9_9GAMM|nr:GNAT family N-acetyltransferase [Solimonas terrae]NGY05696.1 GNAT family N-acetyltransferase [Solimonas terrae]
MTERSATPPKSIIRSARLHLREAADGDADFIIALLNEPGFIRYIGDRRVRTPEDARGYIGKLRDHYWRHGYGLYVVVLDDSAAPIGICGLLRREALDAPDIGFAFLHGYEGQGYAFEAAAAVLADARARLRITRVLALTMPDNERSMRLLRRLGLKRDREVELPMPGDVSVLFVPA